MPYAIPTSATEEFSTGVDGQTAIQLNIYQGERELVRDCRQLGSFTLRGLPPLPAGLPRVAVTFLVDADGVLRVTAVEQRTGMEASIQVVPSFGLTRDEVRRMMLDSIEHAQADYAAREQIESIEHDVVAILVTHAGLRGGELDAGDARQRRRRLGRERRLGVLDSH